MRLLFLILVLTQFVLLAAPFTDSHVDSPKMARAWLAWHANATPENEKLMRQELEHLRTLKTITDGVVVVLIVCNAAALIIVGKRAFRRRVASSSHRSVQ